MRGWGYVHVILYKDMTIINRIKIKGCLSKSAF